MTLGVSTLLAGLSYLPTILRFASNAGNIVETGNRLIINIFVVVMVAYFLGVYLLCKKIYIKSPLMSYIFFTIFVVGMFILRGSEFPLIMFDTFGHTYSVIGGEKTFLLHLALIFWIVKSAWKFFDKPLKNYSLLALAINTPLIMSFGYVFELRNWSLLYPAFIILIAFYCQEKINSSEAKL